MDQMGTHINTLQGERYDKYCILTYFSMSQTLSQFQIANC